MTENADPVYGGKYRRVLDHPDHRSGINHGTMTVTAIRALAPSVVRVTATLDHDGDPGRWHVTNPAIRLELPDIASDATVSRVYTVRAYREDEGPAIDVDVVRHAGESPVMRWLATARAGTTVRILGPRPHFCPPFRDERPVGLFADETAIPALATILRDWPADRVGFAWVETPDQAVVADLPHPDGVTLTWLRREAEERPGSTGRLVSAAAEFGASHPEQITIWACGEHDEMRRIRHHFRHERGMPKQDVEVFGYWRRHLTGSQIDEARLKRYERLLAESDRMTPLDDFKAEE